jgi:hypothetical protein
MGAAPPVSEKRCEWCGTLSPADAEKCTLCRIPFGVPVPPPRDWSELTGNIPVITAPLYDDRAETPAAPVAPPSPVVPPVPVAPPAPEPAPLVQAQPVAPAVQPLAVAAVEMPLAAEGSGEAVEIPGWRAPDDPTLRVFADRLDERARRQTSSRTPVKRRRRGFARLLVWLVSIGLIVAVLVLAPARLPFL